MLKISAQLNDRDFQGTAEELATFVSEKLAELGFGERHRSSERLVRFYAYQKLLSRPEKAPTTDASASSVSCRSASSCSPACSPSVAGTSTGSAPSSCRTWKSAPSTS